MDKKEIAQRLVRMLASNKHYHWDKLISMLVSMHYREGGSIETYFAALEHARSTGMIRRSCPDASMFDRRYWYYEFQHI